MRADRLLAELTLLQARGRMTAAELATEMEVTERTVYRDMYALQVAGVPLIAARGRDGGYSLYGDWRADLTGLTTAEMESLLVASASSAVTRAGPLAATAAAKLAALLPPETAGELSRLRQRIHVVLGTNGGHTVLGETTARLVEALRGNHMAILLLRRVRTGMVRRVAHPLGLVTDGRDWYLVWHSGDGRPRVDMVERIESVEVTSEPAIEAEMIDIEQAWRDWHQAERGGNHGIDTRLRIDGELLEFWCDRYPTVAIHRNRNNAEVTTVFGSIIEARAAVLPWGGAVEVLSPPALRLSVADFAAQTLAVYADR